MNGVAEKCYFCGAGEIHILFKTYDHLFEGVEEYTYMRCPSCGMVFLHPAPGWQSRSRHYELAYRGYFQGRVRGTGYEVRSSQLGFSKRLGIITRYKSSGRLLDVGTGLGDFVSWLSQMNGWRAIGLEPIAQAIQTEHPAGRCDCMVGDALSMGIAADSLEVVTLWSVLEHLQDPVHGLQECLRVLRPGGVLVLRTVNALSWGASIFARNWVGYDAPRVVSIFTPGNLARVLAAVGFRLLETGNYFFDFYPFAWSLENLCNERLPAHRLRNLLLKVIYSPITRLLTIPFFLVQKLAKKNSFMTLVACKPL